MEHTYQLYNTEYSKQLFSINIPIEYESFLDKSIWPWDGTP